MNAEAISRLAALRLSTEDMGEVLAIIAGVSAEYETKLAKFDAAKKKDRERKSAERKSSDIPLEKDGTFHGKSTEIPRTIHGNEPPLARVDPNIKLLVPSSITESKKEVEVAQSAPSTRGTRLSPDWEPKPQDWQFAVDRLGGEGATEETASFKDHWPAQPGQKGVKVNWDGTYRNWIRNARMPTQRAGPPQRQTAKTQFLEVARDLIESQLNEPNRSHAGPQPLGSGRGPEIGSGNKIIALVPNGGGRPVHHEGPPRSLSDFGEGLAFVRGERGM